MTPVEAALVGVCAVVVGLVLGFTIIAVRDRLRRRRLTRATRLAYKQLAADLQAVQIALGEGVTPALRRVANAIADLGRAFEAIDPELRAFIEDRAVDKLYPVDDERP